MTAKALLLFPVLFLTLAGAQTVYYISPTGSDSNPGTLEAPWATPAHAETVISGSPCAPTIVYFRQGTWYQSAIILKAQGSLDRVIEQYLDESDPTARASDIGTGNM